jgi:opacity protein-like surface antigen
MNMPVSTCLPALAHRNRLVRPRSIYLSTLIGSLLAILLLQPTQAAESGSNEQRQAPHWGIELKGGSFRPDSDDYKKFYGSSSRTYFALGYGFRFNNWLELSSELGYSKDTGEGELPSAGATGGRVEYTLVPLQVFLNLRYDVTPDQLFVPFLGVGLATTWYKQDIDQQGNRDGRSDIGTAVRAGIQLSLNRLDPGGARYVSADKRLKSYIFIEGQYSSTEIDDIELGGNTYLLGLRFEFD